jgi:hypothetical protein
MVKVVIGNKDVNVKQLFRNVQVDHGAVMETELTIETNEARYCHRRQPTLMRGIVTVGI